MVAGVVREDVREDKIFVHNAAGWQGAKVIMVNQNNSRAMTTSALY